MAQGDALDSIFNLSAQEADADRLLAKLAEVKGAIISTNEAISKYKVAPNGKIELEGLAQATQKVAESQKALITVQQQYITSNDKVLKSIIDSKSALSANAKLQNELKKDVDAGRISADEYRVSMVKLTDTQLKYKSALAEATKTANNNTKEALGQNDAYKKLAIQYEAAARNALNVGVVYGKNSTEFKNASKDANALGTQLKDLDSAVGKSQRNVGNYTGAISKLWGGFRQLANILPGVGIAGLFLLGFEAIKKVISALGIFEDKLFGIKQQRQLLNDITEKSIETSSKEIASLKILKTEIESTNIPMKTRLQAVKDLQKQYPEYFKGLTTEQILTGNVANAYDLATAAIIRKAKANAAAAEIEKIESEKLKILFKNEKDLTIAREEATKAQDKIITNAAIGPRGTIGKTRADIQKEIIDNYNFKKKAAQDEIDLLNKKESFLLKFTEQGAKDVIKVEEEKQKKVSAIKNKLPDSISTQFERYKIEQQRLIDFLHESVNDESKVLDERLQALSEYSFKRVELIKAQADYDKIMVTDKLAQDEKEVKSEQEKNILIYNADQQIQLIDKKSEDERLRNAESFLKEKKKLIDKYNGTFIEQAKEGAAGQADEEDKETAKRAEETKKLKKDKAKELYSELKDLAKDFFNGQFDAQKNAIEAEKDLLDKQSQQEIERITNSTLSEQDKANKIAIIQANATAKKAVLDQKEKEIEYKRAVFNRGIAIAEVIASVAQAVAKDLKGNKFLIPFDIAIGAAQIAAIAAKPIPRFAKGTGSSPEGLAITDELGAEGYVTPSGKAFIGSNDGPTLRYLEKGTKIIPHDEVNRIMLNSMMQHTAKVLEPKSADNSQMRDITLWQTQQIVKALKAQKMNNKIIIKNDVGFMAHIRKQVFD